MGASLSSMWRDFEKEKSLGRRGVCLQMGMEMSKIKKLEQEIKDLKDLVLLLQSQVIALQARQPFVITPHPLPQPGIQPSTPQLPWWTPTDKPYIGDPPFLPNTTPTITCGSKAEVSGSSNQVSRCC